MPAKVKEMSEQDVIAQFKELLAQHFNPTQFNKTLSLTEQYTNVKNKFLLLIEIRTLISVLSSEYAEVTKQIANEFKGLNTPTTTKDTNTDLTPENSSTDKVSDTPDNVSIKPSGKTKIVVTRDDNDEVEQPKVNVKSMSRKVPTEIQREDDNSPKEQTKIRLKNNDAKSAQKQAPKKTVKKQVVQTIDNDAPDEPKPKTKKMVTQIVDNDAPDEPKPKTKKMVSKPKKVIVSTDNDD
jgi:hypothetical protein